MITSEYFSVLPLILSTAFAQPAKIPAFDVASVKVDTIGTNEGPARGNEVIDVAPSSLTMRNIRLRSAIKWAYHVQTDQVLGPGWLDSDRFLIAAKSAGPVPEEELRLMLQPLLAERFQMKLRRETREMTVFVLVADNGGPKVKPSAETGRGGVHYEIVNKVVADKATLSQFADSLTNALRAVVLNETGLEGRYDFMLDLGVYGTIPQEDFPAVTARGLREQLGLRVESRRRDVPVLIIDHAERMPVQN